MDAEKHAFFKGTIRFLYTGPNGEIDWNCFDIKFQNAKKLFEKAGYILPEVVFWNVASRNRQQPVGKNEQGVALVSGCTPRLFSMIAEGNVSAMTPYQIMLDVLGSERYEKIVA